MKLVLHPGEEDAVLCREEVPVLIRHQGGQRFRS